jgi:hypothetical protein
MGVRFKNKIRLTSPLTPLLSLNGEGKKIQRIINNWYLMLRWWNW